MKRNVIVIFTPTHSGYIPLNISWNAYGVNKAGTDSFKEHEQRFVAVAKSTRTGGANTVMFLW